MIEKHQKNKEWALECQKALNSFANGSNFKRKEKYGLSIELSETNVKIGLLNDNSYVPIEVPFDIPTETFVMNLKNAVESCKKSFKSLQNRKTTKDFL